MARTSSNCPLLDYYGVIGVNWPCHLENTVTMNAALDQYQCIGVVGAGLTGVSCARFLSKQGLPFKWFDSRSAMINDQQVQQWSRQSTGYFEPFKPTTFIGCDLLLVSPGVSLNEPAIQQAVVAGSQIASDLELFVALNTKPVIAITGSNGKSTVATLCAKIIESLSKKVCLAGNIGYPVLDAWIEQPDSDVFVLELSSFQLERVECLQANVVTVLNITPDHMDRYDNFEAYCQQKWNIFRGAGHAVCHTDDAMTKPNNPAIVCSTYQLGADKHSDLNLQIRDGRSMICAGNEAILDTSALRIVGLHNIANVMVAMLLVRALLGVTWQAMINACTQFSGLNHRCAWVRSLAGIDFYNDSKATNPEAAIAAITSIRNIKDAVTLIAGGQDKDSDFKALATCIKNHVDSVVIIGEHGSRLAQLLPAHIVHYAQSMESAVTIAWNHAQTGGAVLLSPAFASFDWFENYQHRGEVFENAVMGLRDE